MTLFPVHKFLPFVLIPPLYEKVLTNVKFFVRVTLQVKNTSLTEPPEVSKISLRAKSIWLFYRRNYESQ